MKKLLSIFFAFVLFLPFAFSQTAQAGGSVLHQVPADILYFFRISTYQNHHLDHKVEDYLNEIFYHNDTVKLFDERTLANIFLIGQGVAPDDPHRLVNYYFFTIPKDDFDAYLAKIPPTLLKKYQEGGQSYYGLGELYFQHQGNLVKVADHQQAFLNLLNQSASVGDDILDTQFLETGFFQGYFNLDKMRMFDPQNTFALPGIQTGGFHVTLFDDGFEGVSRFLVDPASVQKKVSFDPSFLENFQIPQLLLYPSAIIPGQNFEKILEVIDGKDYDISFSRAFKAPTPFGCTTLPTYEINTLFQQPLSYEFKDVKSSDSYYPHIQEMLQQGIMEGYNTSNGRFFMPQNSITRAEFTKLVLAVQVKKSGLGSHADIAPQLYFHDVSPCEWLAPYINKAFTFNFIKGYQDGTFKPHHAISKAEALQLLYNAVSDLQMTTLREGKPPYQDVSEQDWFYVAVQAAYNAGLLSDDSLFHPHENFTRAEAAEMLSSLF